DISALHAFPTRRSSDLGKTSYGVILRCSPAWASLEGWRRTPWEHPSRPAHSPSKTGVNALMQARGHLRMTSERVTNMKANECMRSEEHTSELQSPYDLV